MAGFTLPLTLPLSWTSARSAQFWAGQDRRIYARFWVSRPDGVTWTDLTSYLVSARISLGNVADVGTGNSGVDTGVRQATFELINERRPEIAWDETLARDETYVVGDEADIVGLSTDGGEAIINKLFGATPKSYYAGDSLHPRDRNSSWNYWNGVYAPLLWPTREVILEVAAVPIGVTPSDADWVRLFHGFMGDSISASSDNGRITIECRDLMKRLQDVYIEQTKTYGSEAGTLAETVMQQIINDNVAHPPTLYVPVSPGFMIKPYKVEYQSVADALWQVVNQFGGWIGYKWIPDYNDFRLTLLIPPRGKDAASADWAFDARQIIVQHLDISDRDVRNAVVVTYRDNATGTRQSVTLEDAASIAEFGRRAMQIEEADTSLIDTAAEATALAQVVVHDLKDLTASTRLIMPLVPTMDVFDGILVTNPRLSSTQDFYAVESVEHVLDFDRGQFRTEVVASGRVVGAHTRWLLMETRPGSPGQPAPKTPKYRLIVAAKDSPYEERRNADYFCDGVSDQEQINAAVAALGSAGGEVLLLEGTYIIDGSIVLCSNISLTGQGAATVVKIKDGLATNLKMVVNADTVAGNSQIKIANLLLDGNKANIPISPPPPPQDFGIFLQNVDRCQVQGMWAMGFNQDAIGLHTARRSSISGCTCQDNNYYGIRLYSSTDCNVIGNTLYSNGNGGIYVYGGSGNAITGNSLSANGGGGIYLDATAHIAVSGNSALGNNAAGVMLNCSNDCTIAGNICQRNGTYGIYLRGSTATPCSRNTVSGNTCEGNNRDGICLFTQANDNSIIANTCSANSQGTHLGYSNIYLASDCNYNNIQSNTCRRGSGTNQPAYGIHIATSDCDGNIVTNNDLYTGGASGAFLDQGTGTVTTAGNRV